MKIKFYAFHILLGVACVLVPGISSYAGGLPLQWGTYYGAAQEDYITQIVNDKDGNIYVCGNTQSNVGLATPGTFFQGILVTPFSGGFVAKFNNAGIRQWGTYVPGQAYGIACDQSGYIYVTGTTTATWLGTAGTHKPTKTGNDLDGYILKLTPQGQREWGTYYGANSAGNDDKGLAIEVDGNNNVYLAGHTSSQTDISTPGTHKRNIGNGISNFFLAKFDATGARIWGTYYGSDVNQESADGPGISMAIGLDNDIYLCGRTVNNDNIATLTTQQAFNAGKEDAFLVRFDPSGKRVWATFCGGLDNDKGSDVICDNEGNIYITGYSESSSNIATPNTYQDSYIPDAAGDLDYNAFVVKYNQTGFREWGTYYKNWVKLSPYTLQHNVSARIAYDPAGFICLGTSRSVNNNDQSFTPFDAHVARLDCNTGLLNYDTVYGGNGAEFAAGIVTDSSGNIYLAGFTDSDMGIATPGSHKQTKDYYDGFLAKFLSADTSVYFKNLMALRNLVCRGDTFSVPYSVTYNFNPGNVFTVQLYDPVGTDVYNIGSAVRTGAGSILCYIADTIPLAAYGIRIIATDRPDTTAKNNFIMRVETGFTITVIGDSVVCEGKPINLRVLASPPASFLYDWKGPGGYTSSIENPVIPSSQLSNSGDYVIRVTNQQGGCATKDTFNVRVKPAPAIPIASIDTAVCEKDTIHMQAVSTTPGASYQWVGPAGFFRDTNVNELYIPDAQLNATGTYTVTAGLDGCYSDFVVLTTRVKPLPVFIITNNSPINKPICEGDTLLLSALSNAPDSTMRWTGPDSFFTQSSKVVIYEAAYEGRGEYRIYANYEGCEGYASTNVSIKPKPRFLADNNGPIYEGEDLQLQIADERFPGATYTWVGPDSFRSSQREPVRVQNGDTIAGVYHVQAKLDGCTYTGITTVVQYKRNYDTYFLYPIPNDGDFFVEGTVLYDQEVLFEISNSANQIIGKDMFFTTNKKFKVEMVMEDQLANGQYYFRARLNGKWKVMPFTIIK